MYSKKITKSCVSVILVVFLLMMFSLSGFAENLGYWTTKANLPNPKGHIDAAILNDRIYVIGGLRASTPLNEVDEYNPINDSWEGKASLLTARYLCATAAFNDRLYVFGGAIPYNVADTVEEYNPTTNTWSEKTTMPNPRYGLGAAVVNNKIYVIGGRKINREATNIVEEYDPVTNKWTTKANMPTERYDFATTVVNNKIYILGGRFNDLTTLNTVEEFDPITNTWTTKANMPTTRWVLGTASINGKIYVLGGLSASSEFLNTVEEYDPVMDSWTTKASMPTKRYGMGVVEYKNRIYAIGGFAPTQAVANVEVFAISELNAPVNLIAASGNKQVTLSWDAVSDAISYNVKRATSADGPYSTIAETITGTTYIDTNVTNGTAYYYVVSAVHSPSESPNSNEVSATPMISPLNAPVNLTATSGNKQVALSWDAVSDATSYNVKRATSADGLYSIIAENITGTTYIDTDVTNGTTYYYVVSAVNSTSESPNSNEVSATPKSSSSIQGNRAILRITMVNGVVHEYDLSSFEIDDFLSWYDDKENGVPGAKAYFIINKSYNIGPFISRKVYIIYDKIQEFEIADYND